VIEIRKHPSIRESLYVTGLGLKLPEDYSWVTLSGRFSADEVESSVNLKKAFQSGLVEMRVDGDYHDAPSWFLEPYAANVRIPMGLLDDNELAAVQKLGNLKAAAHPLMWAIIRSELFNRECLGKNRLAVLNVLL
jgi:hypothetical protein